MKIVFMGTPDFAVPALGVLAEKHEVVAVYTQPDRPVGRGQKLSAPAVKICAEKLGLEIRQPNSLKGCRDEIADLDPEAIVVVAYGELLRQEILDLPKFGCINIHSSLLPRWRGAAPIQWAILSGDQETGVTTMFMAKKLDAGPILLQAKTPINKRETAGSLHDRLSSLGASLILETIDGLLASAISPREQTEADVTHASKLTKDMQWLDWREPASKLDLRIRALNPWPGTSVRDENGSRYKILEADLVSDAKPNPGFISVESDRLLLGTSNGALRIRRVQQEGRKAVSEIDFINSLDKNQRKGDLIRLAEVA